jgi:Bacterial protein of unknown function (DUF899)
VNLGLNVKPSVEKNWIDLFRSRTGRLTNILRGTLASIHDPALLKREKAYRRERDEISRQRRELPWVRVEKEYVFDVPEGKIRLADLFDGRSQLFIKHFMMGPSQDTQCVGCSFEVDHIEASRYICTTMT